MMTYLQIIIPIPINDGPTEPMSEHKAKVMLAIFLILFGIFILSLLFELYKQWRDERLINWQDIILPNMIGQAFFHVGMLIVLGFILLIWSGSQLACYL